MPSSETGQLIPFYDRGRIFDIPQYVANPDRSGFLHTDTQGNQRNVFQANRNPDGRPRYNSDAMTDQNKQGGPTQVYGGRYFDSNTGLGGIGAGAGVRQGPGIGGTTPTGLKLNYFNPNTGLGGIGAGGPGPVGRQNLQGNPFTQDFTWDDYMNFYNQNRPDTSRPRWDYEDWDDTLGNLLADYAQDPKIADLFHDANLNQHISRFSGMKERQGLFGGIGEFLGGDRDLNADNYYGGIDPNNYFVNVPQFDRARGHYSGIDPNNFFSPNRPNFDAARGILSSIDPNQYFKERQNFDSARAHLDQIDPTIFQQYRQDYDPAKQAFENLGNMFTPDSEIYQDITKHRDLLMRNADFQPDTAGFEEFARTGGISDRDRGLFRARTTSSIPAIENLLKQRDERFNQGAGERMLGRDFAKLLNEQRIGSETELADQIRSGRQFGIAGKSQAEQAAAALRNQGAGALNQLMLGVGNLRLGAAGQGARGMLDTLRSESQDDFQRRSAEIQTRFGLSSAEADLVQREIDDFLTRSQLRHQTKFGLAGAEGDLAGREMDDDFRRRQARIQTRFGLGDREAALEGQELDDNFRRKQARHGIRLALGDRRAGIDTGNQNRAMQALGLGTGLYGTTHGPTGQDMQQLMNILGLDMNKFNSLIGGLNVLRQDQPFLQGLSAISGIGAAGLGALGGR